MENICFFTVKLLFNIFPCKSLTLLVDCLVKNIKQKIWNKVFICYDDFLLVIIVEIPNFIL